ETGRLRREAQERIRHLHGALGPPGQRSRIERRPDLQRSARQRLRNRRTARDRERLYEGEACPETFHFVPVSYGRREGFGRRQILRREPALSVEQNTRGHQHGWH